MSDLHFEQDRTFNQYRRFDIPPRAKYLILAGDIGSISLHPDEYRNFLIRQYSSFTRVFLVLGNNEFKRGRHTHAQIVATARTFPGHIGMQGRLTFLEHDRFDLYDEGGRVISILGCTLWSQVPAYMRTSDWIHYEGIHGNTMSAHNQRFELAIGWLRSEIQRIRQEEGGTDRRILVVTHHAPRLKGTSTPHLEGSAHSYFFASDILVGDGIPGLGNGDAWVFGHTHYTSEFVAAGVNVRSNQRGRSGDPDRSFDVNKTFEI